MAITAIFVADIHEDLGTLGLRMEGRHWADPFGGIGVAHDLMEHFANDNGSTEHELMAFGASIHVRNESMYYCMKGQLHSSPAENLSSDMPGQCSYRQQRGDPELLRRPGVTHKLDDWLEEILEDVRRKGYKLARDELPDAPRKWLAPDPEKRFIGWMRNGYRKALLRHKGCDSATLCHLFSELEAKADRALQYADPGMRFRASFSPRARRISFTEIEPEEYY
jgi:hypothetical protein